MSYPRNLVNSKRGELLCASFSSFVSTTFTTCTTTHSLCIVRSCVSYSPPTPPLDIYLNKRHRILCCIQDERSAYPSPILVLALFYLSLSFHLYIHLLWLWKESILPSKNHLLNNCALSTFLIDTLLGL